MFEVDTIYKNINKRKFAFVATFFAVVLITYTVLYVLDFYPEPVTSEGARIETTEVDEVKAELYGNNNKDNDDKDEFA